MKITPEMVRQAVQAQEAEMVRIRRWMHENPEVSNQEFKTSQMIVQEIEKLGLPYRLVSPTGVLAELKGGRPGKTVALRADMDALPVEEAPENLAGARLCCSKNPGVMHACGHDAHISMLIGAMRALCGMQEELCGNVLFCFEDGEETCIGENYQPDRSAGAMLEALKGYAVDACWAIHVYNALPVGQICVDAGPRMAGITTFDIEITGKGGHGSRPDQAASPIFAAAYALTNAAGCFVNEVDVTKTVTFGVGTFQAGQQNNIIPETAQITGTARYFDREEGIRAMESVRRVMQDTAQAHRCRLTRFDLGRMGATVNDAGCAAIAREAMVEAFGPERVVSCPPWFASESFSYYLDRYPGVLAHLGIANPQKGTGALHHNPQFDLDEDCLCMGAQATVQYVLAILNK